jgi:hypothetical protein
MKFYRRRSRAGLAAAANVSVMRFSRLGVAAFSKRGWRPRPNSPVNPLSFARGVIDTIRAFRLAKSQLALGSCHQKQIATWGSADIFPKVNTIYFNLSGFRVQCNVG